VQVGEAERRLLPRSSHLHGYSIAMALTGAEMPATVVITEAFFEGRHLSPQQAAVDLSKLNSASTDSTSSSSSSLQFLATNDMARKASQTACDGTATDHAAVFVLPDVGHALLPANVFPSILDRLWSSLGEVIIYPAEQCEGWINCPAVTDRLDEVGAQSTRGAT
jgi:hypothetical protein